MSAMDSGKDYGLDPLYVAKKDVEEAISATRSDEKLTSLGKRKGLRLDNILENKVEIDGDYLRVSSKYDTSDYSRDIVSLVRAMESVRQFSITPYPNSKLEISYSGDEAYNLRFSDSKSNRLFSMHISKYSQYSGNMDKISLYTTMEKEFASRPGYAKEFYSLISKEVVMDGLEKTYANLVVENEEDDDDDEGGEHTLEEILENFGLTVYSGNTSINNIGGYHDVKSRVEREIFTPFIHGDMIKELRELTRLDKKNDTSGAIFYGPPGTGKTMMARAIAHDNDVNFIYMSISKIYSHWYGASSKRMEMALDLVNTYAKKNGKTVLFIDEIDSLGNRQSNYSGESNKVINSLLTRLSGVKSAENSDLMFIACTNLLDQIDQALLSRFKTRIYFRAPNKDDRRSIIATYAKTLNSEEMERFAAKTEGLTGRDIEAIASIAEENHIFDIAGAKMPLTAPDISDYIKAAELFTSSAKEANAKSSGLYS